MDIYSYLKKDHRIVSALMAEVITIKGVERERLYQKIKEELELHAETEEKTFYAALKDKGGKNLKEKEDHAEEEHSEIQKFLGQIDKANPNSDEWLIAFGELKHSVEHHVEEEEGEIFEKAKKVLSAHQAEELAVKMDDLKKKRKGIFSKSEESEKENIFQRIFG